MANRPKIVPFIRNVGFKFVFGGLISLYEKKKKKKDLARYTNLVHIFRRSRTSRIKANFLIQVYLSPSAIHMDGWQK